MSIHILYVSNNSEPQNEIRDNMEYAFKALSHIVAYIFVCVSCLKHN